ncbi:MAG: FAD-binding protein [Streptosporangiales bacterium]|nr:FAD-binding protein [Streptosporangiales bacterium]
MRNRGTWSSSGGGGCGLAGAVRAAQLGAQVLLLEKEPDLGGNTAHSIGSVPGAGTRFQEAAGIADSPAQFVTDLRGQAGEHLDDPVADRLCGISADLVHWLVDEAGVELSLTEDYMHIAHSVNRLHNPPNREGIEIVRYLEATARALGVQIGTGVPVTGVAPDGHLMQVTTATTVYAARNVLLATDGFGADRELVAKQIPEAARLPYFGGPGNTGDGIRLGEQLGGHTASMDAMLGYAAMAQPSEGPVSFETMFSWTVPEKGGIFVTAAGHRFGDESVGYSAFTDEVLAHTEGVSYAVFDQRILDHVCAYEKRFRLIAQRTDTPILRAEEPHALAAHYGLPAAALAASMTAYNAAARGDTADEHGRTGFGFAPLVAPFYIAKTVPGIFTTQGGLRIDADARVLSTDGAPIPRLYAGGGTTAGICGPSGARGYVSGNGLLSALGYGYLAGGHAARSLLQ